MLKCDLFGIQMPSDQYHYLNLLSISSKLSHAQLPQEVKNIQMS